ncbi:alkaline phosphatase D family protein [Sporobolomyces koalae]|uniref:alkaline phosphatase D family protein n=1 Tax=Sporobolomyces koalae TaxID=500713 RepID=UPI00317602BC
MTDSMWGLARSAGGASSALFRFIVYVFLRWIPGRFGPYLIPLFYLTHLWTTVVVNRKIPRRPATPAEAALVPRNPKERPSFADVATQGTPARDSVVHEEHPHIEPTADSSTTASMSKRNKKKKNLSKQVQLGGERSSDATDSSESDSALVKFKNLPRNRPQPKATLSQLVRSLVFGTPTPTSSFLNYTSIAINTLLFAFAMDAIWTPIFGMDEASLAFARVGAVSHNEVKLVARIPAQTSLVPQQPDSFAYNTSLSVSEGLLPEDDFSGAKLAYRPTKPLGKWIAGPDFVTSEANDWVATIKLEGLWASTEYEYRLLRPSSLQVAHHPAFPNVQTFTTFPDPSLSQPTHYTFASSSCVKPGFPWTGPHNKRSVKGAESFLKIAEKVGVRFMVFLGDFIYADVPWLAGTTVDQYNKRYRQIFASPEMKKMVEKIPMVAIYDDHEIVNDFSGNETDVHFAPANSAYQTYMGNANPDPSTPGVNYYDFRVGDSAFFVLDTRAYRSPNENSDDEDKTMLGATQREAFLNWAVEVNQTVTWKFIVSSVPMMSLWNHAEDTWAGFLSERDLILDTLQYVPNVIVLSGDRHEFASAGIRDSVTEFSTSPFNMFYLPIRTLAQSHGRGASGEDALYKYLPDGNTKVTTFEVDTRTINKPVVRVKVYVDAETADDKPAWEVQVVGKPLRRSVRETMAVGGLGMRLKELLSFLKRSWF